ncbi:RmlC-like cupin [Punctularia strigosozonata HHB-11173 SS5]|uniref:RmlC-like cupin n=1 Tax=Punctularia strigosozonata (strain HHB-11173) TaxID=741275 RepID=UPI000441852A|nr:RmlC-like cupin [Punctularia strigosozonata HHB-11173 SS5]EIN08817.1 RmlC-like cupin [Punctularia strigosozonata HHB-11173 SS5]
MRLAQSTLFAASLACSIVPPALSAPLTSLPRFLFARSGDDLSRQLIDQPTALDRFMLLNTSVNNFIFNFFDNSSTTPGPDGSIVLATAENFPSTVGNGVAMGVGSMGPCGLKASEVLFVSTGNLVFGQIQENGATFVTGMLNTGEATVFPQGSIHFQQNTGCDPAQFIAGFGSEDPGRLDIAPALFQDLPASIVNATLGGIGVQEVSEVAAMIPLDVAFGTQACLDRCNITRPGQWTSEAIAEAKRQFDEFMKQGPVKPADFKGLPSH